MWGTSLIFPEYAKIPRQDSHLKKKNGLQVFLKSPKPNLSLFDTKRQSRHLSMEE